MATVSTWPASARAQRRGFGPNPDPAPSVFAYGFRGFGIGLPVGLATGYLITRDGDWDNTEWLGLAYGAGVGAIGGSVIGLGIGFYDLAQSRPGVGMVVLRDTWYGVALGAAIGLVAGGLAVASNGDWESLAYGAAWGTVIGAPVGAVIGIIEGPTVRDLAWSQQNVSPFRFTVVALDSRRAIGAPWDRPQARLSLLPALQGQF